MQERAKAFSSYKDYLGKDITSLVVLPVWINQPFTMLQVRGMGCLWLVCCGSRGRRPCIHAWTRSEAHSSACIPTPEHG